MLRLYVQLKDLIRRTPRILRGQEGAQFIEYAVLAILLALGVIVGIIALAGGLNTLFNAIGTEVGDQGSSVSGKFP